MKRSFIFLLGLLCIIMVEAKNHYFKHLGVSDGLSQVCIFSIYQDELGAVWLGTSEGLNRYNGKDVKIFRPSQGNEGLTNNEINKLCGDKKGRIYIRSGNDLIKFELYKERFTCLLRNDVRDLFCKEDTLWVSCKSGIYYYTAESSELTFFTKLQGGVGAEGMIYVDNDFIWVATNHLVAISRKNPKQQKILASFDRGSQCISGDSAGNIWVGTWNGLYKISANREMTRYINSSDKGELSDNQIRCVLEDDFKHIWVGTFRGLDCYDPTIDKWEHYTRYGDSPNTLSHHSVLSLHKDMQGNIWVGTYYGGVNVFNPSKTSNHFYYAEPLQEDCLSFPVVGKMAEDSSGRLWICTEGGGLNCYNADTGIFTRYQHRKGDASSVGSNNLKSIFYRKENERLYVGAHLGGIFVLDLKSNKGHTLHNIVGDPTSLPHEIVNDIQEYKDGLALLTQGGVAFMDPVTEKFSPLSNDVNVRKLLNKRYAFETFLIDSRQRMWLASVNGGVICVDLPSSKITEYAMDTNNPSSIGRFKVVHIFEDSRGSVFFCTIGSGIYEYQEGEQSFKSYSTSNQCLPSDYCYYICESVEDHRLFILHGKGLSIFNREKGEVENTYHLFNQTYSQGSALYLDKNGTLFISGTNGLALFQKQSLYALPSKSLLNFDKLFIFNEEICPNDQSGILTDILAKTSDIYLSYKQNNITVEFASFNYNNDRNRLFEYRLEGFDKAWTQTTGTTITYTNLPPGEYILRARPLAGKENLDEEVHLNIHVSAPFYATVWAYFFYLLCLLGVMIAFIRFKTRQAALKSSLEFERKEKERIEELNQVKLRFFTNISHDFRTPLTLVADPVEQLLADRTLTGDQHRMLLLIQRNVNILLRLVNQILDFRKYENGKMEYTPVSVDILSSFEGWNESFQAAARKKHIHFSFDNMPDSNYHTQADVEKLERIYFNLLSNAFKFTPENGKIAVRLSTLTKDDSRWIRFTVSNTGSMISAEHIRNIFDRFYKIDMHHAGSGIGLALVKAFVELHGGTISVESDEKQGTVFTVDLPVRTCEVFSLEDSSATSVSEVSPLNNAVPVEEEELEKNYDSSKPSVLIIDDNADIRLYVHGLLHADYTVIEAADGSEGIRKAMKYVPDLIISDVMMPGIDGVECCRRLKSELQTCHIPVILLTACSLDEQRIQGYDGGADSYISKPFSSQLLLARVRNLIDSHRRLKQFFGDGQALAKEDVCDMDKEFVEKFKALIDEKMGDSGLNVEDLGKDMGLSRVQLYRKIKSLTNYSPNELLRIARLKKAASLLASSDMTVSEIGYEVGFSSPSYFAKCYKELFGESPTDLLKRKG